ncbi:hypothetical protein [Cellulomonas endophytica]|uniref:hypothetical protein n=1 Tax=Cellulomonas endophytica TaxID=2494735 RepID=UPI001F0C1024|nr:hypothetical protein [Cellulomonas endophytica]
MATSQRVAVATDTYRPWARAAFSSAMSVIVGPYSGESSVMTPMAPVRRVTRARAAVLRR